MYEIPTVQTGAQRIQQRHDNIKKLKHRINQYVCNLDKNDREKLYRCYATNKIDFRGLNQLVMPNDFRSPVAHHCFRIALDIQF